MKYALEKDRRRRRIFCRRELSSLGFRVVLRSQLVSPAVRLRLYPAWNGRLQALPGRIRRRCFLTARSGSPVASFGVSRLSFRSLANGGLLAGVVRSSWLFLLLVYMASPLFQLVGSLPSRQRSRRPLTVSAGSRAAVALVRLLRGRGHLSGFRRLSGGRLELRLLPAHPVPRPTPFSPLRRRSVLRLPATLLLSSGGGLGSQSLLVRRRLGGLPLLLPLGR